MACLKINCSCELDSSNNENLSKLLIRPNNLAPFKRKTVTVVFSRRSVFKNASWMFCGTGFPSDMDSTQMSVLKGGGTVRLQQDYNNDRRVTSSTNVGATAKVASYLNGPSGIILLQS